MTLLRSAVHRHPIVKDSSRRVHATGCWLRRATWLNAYSIVLSASNKRLPLPPRRLHSPESSTDERFDRDDCWSSDALVSTGVLGRPLCHVSSRHRTPNDRVA
jgi:hypothetical protein